MPLTDTAIRGVKPTDNPQKLFDGKGSVEYMLFNLDEKYQDKGIDGLVNLASIKLLESYGGSTIRVG